MTDPRTSTALHHLALDDESPRRFAWSVVVPDPSGRLQLPTVAVDLLGDGLAHARVAGGVLVLAVIDEGPGRRIRVDRRGRLYVPVWLRRPSLVVLTDPGEGVVVLADVAVLDATGERLVRAARV